MRNPSLSLKLAFTFSFAFSYSLTLSSSFSPSLPSLPKLSSPLSLKSSSSASPSSPSPSQQLAADLLALLGSKRDAARIPAGEAREFRSCLRFLVPFDPPSEPSRLHQIPSQRDLLAGCVGDTTEFDEMVWWPPAPVMELARLAVDSGGDPGAIHRTLDPSVLPVPDVEGLKKDKCQLTRTPYGRRFVNEELNSYFAFLFELIVARAPLVGLNVSLSRYDLFHGHLFLASESGRLGILFHAKEYPAYDKKSFPYNLGHCQTESDVVYDDSMNLRNILWLAPLPSNATKAWVAPGVLVVLDADPEGIIYKKLVPEYVDFVRTIYEDDFGEVVADVNYLNMGNVVPGDRIFIC
ncbi:uncharacterized protein [Elaeis guineensis]|uniref:uncharacterized protein n=1 Tax=Elaeis guineensis var. tenera TaxID=51953 RepID=UPI003C6D8538